MQQLGIPVWKVVSSTPRCDETVAVFVEPHRLAILGLERDFIGGVWTPQCQAQVPDMLAAAQQERF